MVYHRLLVLASSPSSMGCTLHCGLLALRVLLCDVVHQWMNRLMGERNEVRSDSTLRRGLKPERLAGQVTLLHVGDGSGRSRLLAAW